MSSRHQLIQEKAKRYGYIERKKVTFPSLELYYVKEITFGSDLYSLYVSL